MLVERIEMEIDDKNESSMILKRMKEIIVVLFIKQDIYEKEMETTQIKGN